jgi:hypothetical protein
MSVALEIQLHPQERRESHAMVQGCQLKRCVHRANPPEEQTCWALCSQELVLEIPSLPLGAAESGSVTL